MARNWSARHEGWSPCTGEIEHFVKRERRRKGGVVLGKMLGGAAVGALLVIVFTGPPEWAEGPPPVGDFRLGGITCSEVRANVDDFMAGKLDAATAERIRIHLRECPHCSVLLERMLENPALPSEETDDGHHNSGTALAGQKTLRTCWDHRG